MTTRQKATAGLTVVIVLIVVWQIMSLFSGGSSKAPTTPTVATANKGTVTTVTTNRTMQGPQGQHPNTVMATPAGGGMSAQQFMQPTQPLQPTPVSVQPTVNDALTKIQKDAQDKYIQQMAQLQSLKLQQQIAETNGAIATAKLNTLNSEKSISDLLASSAPVPVSSSSFGSLIGAPPGMTPPGAPHTPISTTPPATIATTTTATTTTAAATTSYTLVSVSMQLQRWTAVIGYNSKLYNVVVGDKLPPDGSIVESITRNAVELRKDGKITRLTIVSEV